MKAVVFGELCIDLVVHANSTQCSSLAFRGETYSVGFGGKGANQAIAAKRLGFDAVLIGRVGDDRFGKQLIRNLSDEGVCTNGLAIDHGSSPLAIMGVANDGEFTVLSFVEGVNRHVDSQDVKKFKEELIGASVALFQLGYPVSAVLEAATAARSAGVLTILDPAPVEGVMPESLYSIAKIITPNEYEASQLVGFPVYDAPSAAKAANILHDRGSETVIVKLGAQGALCASHSGTFHQPTISVLVADTIGAGDAFNAALADALSRGLPLHLAVLWAVSAGTLSVTVKGAQLGLPSRKAVAEFVEKHSDQLTRSVHSL